MKMKKIFLTLLCCSLFVNTLLGQVKKETNTWALGIGLNNFIMHGDLRSIGTSDNTNYLNFGAYAYVDKMFNPVLGLELKASFSNIAGGAQYFSNGYILRYVNATDNVIRDNMNFEGTALGGELNLIISLSNLYRVSAEKWHFASYFGIGYHQYTSKLFEKLDDGSNRLLVNFADNVLRDNQDYASSIYFSGQLGIKRKISKRIDVEFRTGIYFNNEDHLDATVSDKQNFETFFVSSLGLVVKLGKKKEYTIWAGEKGNQGEGEDSKFKIVDTDGDGVMDELDVEPNTPKGVRVYGNGVSLDSDNDGLPDHKDKCPLEYGPITNEGCPLNEDTDGDGIIDSEDLCPNTPGVLENKGCPKKEDVSINQEISFLASNIYFDTNSDKIKPVSISVIDKIILLMKKVPDSKYVIEGHTDNRSSDKYNLLLSQKRAHSVVKYMLRREINPDRIKAVGYGESRPRYDNSTEGGRQLNRRVEINYVDSFDGYN